MPNASSSERRRFEKLAKEGFLPIRETFLVVPEKTSATQEEAFTTQSEIGTRDDFDEKPLKKRGGILQSNKNGLRRGAKSQKQRKKEKYHYIKKSIPFFTLDTDN